ncbi:ZIP family metal transporter [Candidatus Woesearchaeota archaeon]|jgi:zinc and cadmium transporter|nr:ZIP family metal transporter [Candidatus Woesearchaeota archaeon]
MQEVWVYSLVSVVFISLMSLIGIFTLIIEKNLMNKILIYMVSFAAGALLGDAFIHLLPEIVNEVGFGINISLYIILGIAVLFVIEKTICWRHCHLPITDDHVHPFAIMNLVGDGIHNFIDGLIIGASYLASIPVGIATTIAVIFHEVPQEIADFGVLLHGNFTKAKALFFNFITAITAIIGAVTSLLLANHIDNITTFLLPFAAGGFIYIAGADLIPELHKDFEVKKSLIQLLMFLLGVSIMFLLLFLE